MAWSWSHTQEAYDNAAARVHLMSKRKLVTIWAEWSVKISDPEDSGWDEQVYQAGLKTACEMSSEELADDVCRWMEDDEIGRTCSNGGHNAWACPYGCLPHCVSFDKLKPTEELKIG